MSEPPLLLEAVELTRAFGGPAATPVLKGVNLQVRRGESVAVVGPSGSGKSTLLHLLGALDEPTSGRVAFEGRDLGSFGEADRAALRNRRLGIVFQRHYLLPACTAMENVLVPTLAGPRDPEAPARARRLIERVGLGHRLDYRPGLLSGGECQRVAVARALVNRPSLLLADEPTGSLDRESAEALGDLLAELNREDGLTLVVVTHAAALAARMGRTLELRDGRLRAAAEPLS